MRPCNKCRAPIGNEELLCQKCAPTPETAPVLEITEGDDSSSNPSSIHSWLPGFIYNTVYVGVIVAIPIMVLGTPIGMLLGDHRIGVVLGFTVGPIVGLGFALLELSQSE